VAELAILQPNRIVQIEPNRILKPNRVTNHASIPSPLPLYGS